MSNDTTIFTITVLINDTELVRQVKGTHWRRDDTRNVWIYAGNEPVMEVESEHFVEIVRESNINSIST